MKWDLSWFDAGWPQHCPRHREKWTAAEEQRLLQLFEEAERQPRRVLWFGKWRTKPRYYVAKKLGRTPSTVVNKRWELMRCRRRVALIASGA